MSNACKGLRRNCLAQVAIVLRSPASMLVPYHLEPIPVSGAKTIVNVVTRRIGLLRKSKSGGDNEA
jgi:hypothetical protein